MKKTYQFATYAEAHAFLSGIQLAKTTRVNQTSGATKYEHKLLGVMFSVTVEIDAHNQGGN